MSFISMMGWNIVDCSDTTMMSFIWLLLNVRFFFLCVWNRVDLWALGCIIYHMLEGRPPYKADTEYLTFQKVLSREFVMPSHFSPAAKDLINRLLVSLWLAPFKELSILVITLICMQCLFPVNAVKMLKYIKQLHFFFSWWVFFDCRTWPQIRGLVPKDLTQ